MRSIEWALTQYDCCTCKKRFGYRHTPKEDVKIQGEDNHPQAKEKGLRKSFSRGTQKEPTLMKPVLGFPASRIERK